jgi:hypothetical protein
MISPGHITPHMFEDAHHHYFVESLRRGIDDYEAFRMEREKKLSPILAQYPPDFRSRRDRQPTLCWDSPYSSPPKLQVNFILDYLLKDFFKSCRFL